MTLQLTRASIENTKNRTENGNVMLYLSVSLTSILLFFARAIGLSDGSIG